MALNLLLCKLIESQTFLSGSPRTTAALVIFEPRRAKTGLSGFRPCPTQPACTVAEGYKPEIKDLESRRIVLFV